MTLRLQDDCNGGTNTMAKLTILEFPDERLRTKAAPVETVDDEVRQLVDDMLETMYAAPGIGLAATQVDVHRRVIVIDVSEDQSQPWVLINPEVTLLGEEREPMQEGCLSIPEYFAEVPRALRVQLKALDRDGSPYETEADGLLAHCIQHELDHLEGVLFVDYLSPLKRDRVLKKMNKRHRMTQSA
ncbi:peptide deformylase [Halomonas huangheensis]|uniref:Peptide deformylase n=2 Tax=Halomonas huangheensis TaxID=1178482 RepID=W1NBX5_9GAMM|nr:peptide deformylase [Halomonas huangheensis]